MKFLSLFTGIGGFDSGFEAAGMTNGAMCEIDRWASMVLRYHLPDVEILKDVRKITRSTLSFQPDVICGGFPCQDLSVAGKRKGMAGKRSGLWFEFRRIIDEVKPRWVVVENVPGLFSSQEGRDFAVIIRGMEELGYVGAWKTFDSQYFGVAQRRRRVFIIGHLGAGGGQEILFERQSLQGDPAESKKAGEGATYDVAPCLASSGRGTERAGESRGQDPVVATYRMKAFGDYVASSSSSIKYRDHKDSTDLIAHSLPARGDSSEDGTGRGTPLVPIAFCHRDNGRDATENLSQTLRCFNPASKGVNLPVGGMAVCFQQNTRDEVRQVNGDGRIAGCLASEAGMKQQNYVCLNPWDPQTKRIHAGDVSPTLSGSDGSGGQRQPYHAVRRLTPRECERLQGFPDDWTRWGRTKDGEIVEISDTQRYKMLGNAVTRTVGEWIGRRIVKAASELERKKR